MGLVRFFFFFFTNNWLALSQVSLLTNTLKVVNSIIFFAGYIVKFCSLDFS